MTGEVDPKKNVEFEKAVKKAKNLPDQIPTVLLEMYGLYKQALQGDVIGKRPGPIKVRERYKFDAWSSRKGMSREDAMKAYIELIDKLENT